MESNGNTNDLERKPEQANPPPRSIQFGVFDLRLDTGELFKHGLKVRLQGKPCQILQALLERPGSVVTREDLHARLWASDSSVDFESSLNTAANRLRITLGDSAENPRYVETLPRVGYRFIAPIREGGAAPAEPVALVYPALASEQAPEAPPAISPPENAAPAPHSERREHHRGWWLAYAAACAVLLLATAWTFRKTDIPPASFRQLTFRRGAVSLARFAPDGETVLYTARWSGGTPKLYTTDPVSPESRDLGFAGAYLGAVSHKGELALLATDPIGSGATLLRVRENGGDPLPVTQRAIAADWSPDGDSLAMVRLDDRGWVVEFPRGKVIYRSRGWLSSVRVSPGGDRLAVVEHPIFGDDDGAVRIIERGGETRILSDGWASIWGLAWAPSGQEIWFTAARTGMNRSLHAVSLAGRLRDVASTPGGMTLEDISRSGKVLISHGESRMMMVSSGPNGAERDYSWFDLTRAQDISADGKLVLFDESGEGGGPGYSVYIYRTDSGSVVRLGEGRAMAISPDGKSVLTEGQVDASNVRVISLDPRPARTISSPGMTYIWAKFLPDGKHIVFGGAHSGSSPRIYTQAIDGMNLRAIQPNLWLKNAVVSPDGAKLAGLRPDGRIALLDLEGHAAPEQINLPLVAAPLRWSADGRYLFAATDGLPAKILRIDAASGSATLWKTVGPSDLSGVSEVISMLLSGDGETAIYSYVRTLSELYVVSGWK